MAATTISASPKYCLTCSIGVLEWTTVTLASAFVSKLATGFPTISDLPKTTADFPSTSTPDTFNKCIIPFGVQGINFGSPPFLDNSPTLKGPNPSTSLSDKTAFVTFVSSI